MPHDESFGTRMQAMNEDDLVMESDQAELLNEYDTGLDEDEYNQLDRTSAWLTGMITRLVQAGFSPEYISGRLVRRQPHKWILSKQVQAAARHIQRQRKT